MKKRILAMLLAAMLMLSLLPVSALAADATSGTCGENATWSFDEVSGTLTISGTGEMEDFDWESAPWQELFVKKVVVGEGITTIGTHAFLFSCASEVSLPRSLKEIHDYAFWNSSFREINIPSNVSKIGSNVFGASHITAVADLNNPWFYNDGQGVLYNKDTTTLYSAPPSLKGDYVIPDTVTFIEEGALMYCEQMTSCYIPAGIEFLESDVFYGCESLTMVTIAPNHPRYVSDEQGAVYSKDMKQLHFLLETYQGEYRLPASVEKIGTNSTGIFKSCYGLERIIVEDGNRFFCNDESGYLYSKDRSVLYWVDDEASGVFFVPDTVRIIGECAFWDCMEITELVLPNNLKNIEFGAMTDMSISEITIPQSVEAIVGFAFQSCDDLADVYFTGSEEQWQQIDIGENGNEYLLGANIHFNAEAPNVPCSHKSETVKGKAATCTATGLTDGAKCSVCGEVLTKQETIPATGHKFSGGKCSVCGAADPNYKEPTPPAGDNPFTDVPNDAWYAAPVLWAKANNVTGGTSATTFGPDDSCTRAQVVTFLWAANGKPEPKSMDNPFSDVANDAWYLKPVLWAVEQGITGGVAEGKFGPNQTCTRAQIATFLYAAKGKPAVNGTSTFKDVANGDWFAKPVIWAAENEVTGGIGDGKFGPNNTCTRAQVVTFLYKVYADK